MWLSGAAKAATEALCGRPVALNQTLSLLDSGETLSIPIVSSAVFAEGKKSMAIAHCETAHGMDLLNGLEIWVLGEWSSQKCLGNQKNLPESWLEVVAGMGVGTIGEGGRISISSFALKLLHLNLRPLVPLDRSLRLEIVFPKGRELAARTSNHAFGVVNGLALIGTQAEVQVSASPEKLKISLAQLRKISNQNDFHGSLILVVGENGLDLATNLGLDQQPLLKVGNWLGPHLIEAAQQGVRQLLLFGYHGKLIKLAGGIFHTHHHLADGRLEILVSLAVNTGLPLEVIRSLSSAKSIEGALIWLEDNYPAMVLPLWKSLVEAIEIRSANYLSRHGSWPMRIGSAVFDRKRRLRWAGSIGIQHLSSLGTTLEDF